MNQINTPYDDVFRTLLNDCSSLIIPVINEVFQDTHYTGKEEIIFSPNERFLNRQDGDESKRVTDTSFKIVGKETRKYHLECQSRIDYSMLIRFWEYDTQIAMDGSVLQNNVLTVTLPQSAVLFLRCNQNTPDNMQIRILTPGGKLTYPILVMKTQQYTLEELFEKKLLFLIPFYIFSHEKRFKEYETDPAQLEHLKSEYQSMIDRLEELVDTKEIDEYTKHTILDMSKKVFRNITKDHETVREGVNSVMVGRVLDYEAKTIKNEGLQEGFRKGKQEGLQEGKQKGLQEGLQEGILIGKLTVLFNFVHDKKISVQEAAARADMTEEAFLKRMQENSK